jgi:transposase, IS5 family
MSARSRPVSPSRRNGACRTEIGAYRALDHTVKEGNPADAPRLAPANQRISRRTGQTPRAVAADRGYGEAGVETDLHDAGVTTVAIPRKGKPAAARQAHERQPGFRRLVKWRTGCEGRISHLKHRNDLHRTRLDGHTGAPGSGADTAC